MRIVLFSISVLVALSATPARAEDPTRTFLQKYGDETKEPVDPELKHRWFFKVLTRMEAQRDSLEKRVEALDKALSQEHNRSAQKAGQPAAQQLMLELKEFLDDIQEAEFWVNGFQGKPGYINIYSYFSLLLQNNLILAEKAHAVHWRYYPVKFHIPMKKA